jgi:hypothetical protein
MTVKSDGQYYRLSECAVFFSNTYSTVDGYDMILVWTRDNATTSTQLLDYRRRAPVRSERDTLRCGPAAAVLALSTAAFSSRTRLRTIDPSEASSSVPPSPMRLRPPATSSNTILHKDIHISKVRHEPSQCLSAVAPAPSPTNPDLP